MRVARLDPLWVEVILPVAMYRRIEANMLAEVSTGFDGGQTRDARVLVVDPMADAASGTFRARLELPNPEGDVLGGVKCTARFPEPARYAPDQPAREIPPLPPAPEPMSPPTESDQSGKPSKVAIPSRQSVEPIDRAATRTAPGFVVVTAILNADARRRFTTALRKAGVEDFAFLASGPYRGRISFGIYEGPKFAERRKSQLAALGFAAEVVPRVEGTSSGRSESVERDVPPSNAQATARSDDRRYDDRG